MLYSIKESIIKLRTLSTNQRVVGKGQAELWKGHPTLPKRVGHEALRQGEMTSCPSPPARTSTWPLSHKAAHDHSSIEISATGIQGLQATYHQVLLMK